MKDETYAELLKMTIDDHSTFSVGLCWKQELHLQYETADTIHFKQEPGCTIT